MLEEFDLDAPEEDKSSRNRFRLATRSLTALFETHFSPAQGDESAWKVLVEVVPSVHKYGIRDLLGALTVQVPGDISAFWTLTDYEKSQKALDWLWEGINTVREERDWSLDPFSDAKQAVLDLNFSNTWVWKKPIANPANTLTAEVYAEHKIEEIRISIRFRTLAGELLDTVYICSELPNEFLFDDCFGKLAWVDDTTASLTSKSGKRVWSAELDQLPRVG